jgi:hypothetical protein
VSSRLRFSLILAAFAVALVSGQGAGAFAASSITETRGATLSITNDRAAVRLKLTGVDATAPCAHLSMSLKVEWPGAGGRAFAVESTCSRDSKQVWRFQRQEPNGNLVTASCRALTRSSRKGLATATIPRSCLTGAGSRLRARAQIGGAGLVEVGPTPYARRS